MDCCESNHDQKSQTDREELPENLQMDKKCLKLSIMTLKVLPINVK
jgi:hypothetical protein